MTDLFLIMMNGGAVFDADPMRLLLTAPASIASILIFFPLTLALLIAAITMTPAFAFLLGALAAPPETAAVGPSAAMIRAHDEPPNA